MNELFISVLSLSVKAVPVILAVMLVRLILSRSPKKYSYLLWSVAAFRLCSPVAFKLPFNLTGFLKMILTPTPSETVTTVTPDNVTVDIPKAPIISAPMQNIPQTGEMVSDNAVTDIDIVPQVQQADVSEIILTVCAAVWLAVVFGIVIYAIVGYIRMYRKMSSAVQIEDNIYTSEEITSPFVLGFIKPKIYVPHEIGSETLKYSILHERCHIRRLDHIIKPLACIILAVHWFNPLCHIAFRLMSRDMELSCDEKVLSKHNNIRKEYSMALLNIATKDNMNSPSAVFFGETDVKRRIKASLNWRKPKLSVTVLSVLLCALVFVSCTTDGDTVQESGQPVDKEEQTTAAETTVPDTGYVPWRYLSDEFKTELDSELPSHAATEQEAVKYAEKYAHEMFGAEFDKLIGKTTVTLTPMKDGYNIYFCKTYGKDGFIEGANCHVSSNERGIVNSCKMPRGNVPSDFDEKLVEDLTEDEVISTVKNSITSVFGDIAAIDDILFVLENIDGKYVIYVALDFDTTARPSEEALEFASANYFEIHPHGHNENSPESAVAVFAGYIYDFETGKVDDELTLKYAIKQKEKYEEQLQQRQEEIEKELEEKLQKELEEEQKFAYLYEFTGEELVALDMDYPAPDRMTVYF